MKILANTNARHTKDSVYDFIYYNVGGTTEISIIGSDARYIKEPFYTGTPNKLFDSKISDIPEKLKGWRVSMIWVENNTLVISAEGGSTPEWMAN